MADFLHGRGCAKTNFSQFLSRENAQMAAFLRRCLEVGDRGLTIEQIRDGKGIYVIDRETGEEGEAEAFPTPQELWQRTFAEENAWRDRFAAIPYPDKGGSWQIRFYQEIAVKRVLEAIASGQNRILLTLATGTGKTSIAFQILWKLFAARWNLSGEPTRRPRILFLAGRKNLLDQAPS